MPEIIIDCAGKRYFTTKVTVAQYKAYASIMEIDSDGLEDTLFQGMRLLQELSGAMFTIDELEQMNIEDFLHSLKLIHKVMQGLVLETVMTLINVDQIEREQSAFDEYDKEEGYEDEEEEYNLWSTQKEIIERIIKLTIRLTRNSYSECMNENIIELLEYLRFELDTIDE